MGIKDGIVELKNGIRLPASQAKLEQIKTKLSDFWSEQIWILYIMELNLASSVEVFVLYKIYSILLYKQRGKQNFILDRELAIIGTVLIQICNHVSIFSYFTIILFVLYMSITAKIIYRRKYVELFSIASFMYYV